MEVLETVNRGMARGNIPDGKKKMNPSPVTRSKHYFSCCSSAVRFSAVL
jgi:hypothetical protein